MRIHRPLNNRNIYRFNGRTFDQVPGALAAISVGAADAVWGINAAHQVFRSNGRTFDLVPGVLLRTISASWGPVWGIDAANQIFRFNWRTFDQIPGTLVSIAVGVGIRDKVWGVNAAQEVFEFNGRTFDQIRGAVLSAVFAGGGIPVWGIDAANQIFRYGRGFHQVPGFLTSIAVGVGRVSQDQFVWGINAANEVFRFDDRSDRFQLVPGLLTSIVAHSESEIWGINAANQIFRFNGRTFDQAPGNLASIAVGKQNNGESHVWGLF